jgi:hypothetical protein
MKLRYCNIEWTDKGARVTFGPVFRESRMVRSGGVSTEAWPHPEDPHYYIIAERCGYGRDIMRYCREHELAHAIVAEAFQHAASYVLHSLAYEFDVDQGVAIYEECTAQTLQRWARAGEEPIIGGCDWRALKAHFLACADQLDKEYELKKGQRDEADSRAHSGAADASGHGGQPAAPAAGSTPSTEDERNRFFHV